MTVCVCFSQLIQAGRQAGLAEIDLETRQMATTSRRKARLADKQTTGKLSGEKIARCAIAYCNFIYIRDKLKGEKWCIENRNT